MPAQSRKILETLDTDGAAWTPGRHVRQRDRNFIAVQAAGEPLPQRKVFSSGREGFHGFFFRCVAARKVDVSDVIG